MTPRIVIKKVNKHLIDVFHGEEGFESHNWTRFVIVNGFLKFLAGVTMTPADLQQVKKVMQGV
jgi:hypothetical protein